MGVRGLTTFINRNEKLYMDPYIIPRNSILVLDGESVAANIYLQLLKERNTFFGGDYEIYAEAVIKFFKMLTTCKIIPYVVCSGATESRKVHTLLERMHTRIGRIIQLDVRSEINEPIYPLFIGEVFRDVLKKLDVKMVVCDFEGDLEAANIAAELDVPVLSLDSDFYIFDVKYIPFCLQRGQDKIPNLTVCMEQDLVLKCKIFNREKFLNETGLSKEMLPILSVLVGNDFIERVTDVRSLFRHLKIRSTSRDYINNIVTWLNRQRNSREAVESFLTFFGKSERDRMRAKIAETIKGYTCDKSKYMKYLDKEIITDEDETEGYIRKFPKHFLVKYRCGAYQHNFMEIILNHRYYPKPMVENIRREHCYRKSYQVISAIHKILTNSSRENFIVFARIGRDVQTEFVPPYKEELPNFEKIQEMEILARKNLLLEILQIESTFVTNCLNLFEDSWHIFLLTIKYLSNVSEVPWAFIYSLIVCKIILTYIDPKLGQIRSRQELYQRYPKPKKTLDGNNLQRSHQLLSVIVNDITMDDCALALDVLLPYFHMKNELKVNNLLFDRDLLHLMSEFQTCLLHINFLNALLNSPFEKCYVFECYNGTFIYGFTSELYSKDLGFVPYLLKQTPTIHSCFNFIKNGVGDKIKAY